MMKTTITGLLLLLLLRLIGFSRSQLGTNPNGYRHDAFLEDYTLSSPLDSERWNTFGKVGNAQNGNNILIGGSLLKSPPLYVGSIWSKRALPSVVLMKDFNWELRASLITHTSLSPDHEHGFGIWLAAESAIHPKTQWGISSKNFTGIGVFVAEFGDFADASSQIVDVYGVTGQNVPLISDVDEDDEDLSLLSSPTSYSSSIINQQPKKSDRSHCSINSWDVHQRDTRLIIKKEGSIVTVKFSACDDFELDISGLQNNPRSNLRAGISFWTTRNSDADAIQVQTFHISRLNKGQFLVHAANEGGKELNKSLAPDKNTEHEFNFPYREVKVESFSSTQSFNNIFFKSWKMTGMATTVKTSGEKQTLRLTGVEKTGAGALLSLKPIERRFLEPYSTWQIEAVFRIPSKSRRGASSGFALWLATAYPTSILNNTGLAWNSSFTGFGLVLRWAGEKVYVLTVSGRNLDFQWGENQAIKSSDHLAVKCILEQSEVQGTSHIVRLKKQGSNIYTNFLHCIVVFEITPSYLQNAYDPTKPIFRIGTGAWSSDVNNFRDIQSITFSDVVRVSPSAPVFANVQDTTFIEVPVPENASEVELDCETSWTYPKPKITWKKLHGSMEGIKLAEADDRQTLNIPSARSYIGERYMCIVENYLGNLTRSFQITADPDATSSGASSRRELSRLRLMILILGIGLAMGLLVAGGVIIRSLYLSSHQRNGAASFSPGRLLQKQHRFDRGNNKNTVTLKYKPKTVVVSCNDNGNNHHFTTITEAEKPN